MDDRKMVHMANQIAAYFQAYPKQRAREGVRDHILKFWPPNMRTQLVAYKAAGGKDMHPLVSWAAEQIAETEAQQA